MLHLPFGINIEAHASLGVMPSAYRVRWAFGIVDEQVPVLWLQQLCEGSSAIARFEFCSVAQPTPDSIAGHVELALEGTVGTRILRIE